MLAEAVGDNLCFIALSGELVEQGELPAAGGLRGAAVLEQTGLAAVLVRETGGGLPAALLLDLSVLAEHKATRESRGHAGRGRVEQGTERGGSSIWPFGWSGRLGRWMRQGWRGGR